MDEPADYPAGETHGYAQLHRAYFDPIERAHALMLRVSTAIANEFGAFG